MDRSFLFLCIGTGGVNDTNQLTVTKEGGSASETITNSYNITTAGTYTFTGSYEKTVNSDLGGSLHVIEVNCSEAVTIILDQVTINLTNETDSYTDCNLIEICENSRYVTLQLKGNNTLILTKTQTSDRCQQAGSQAAIEVCQRASLTIQSADNNDATGKLTVKSIGGNWGGAAIGSAAGSAGTHTRAGAITIKSGTIIATSEGATQGAAAIGGGLQGDASSITINGGIITAQGGGDSYHTGAGIGGGGAGGAAGNIVINGGYVVATGGKSVTTAPGIGGGNGGNNNGIFSTGDNGHAVIIASSIGNQTNINSWSGLIFEGDEGKIYGSSYYILKKSIVIPSDKTLKIKEGQTLIINDDVTLTNDGRITNNGKIWNAGTITSIDNISGSGKIYTKLKEFMIEIAAITYTGSEVTPTVTISSYTAGTDYTLAYSNNTNAGNAATVTVTPVGKLYGDPITKTFTIQPKSLSFTFNGIDSPIPYDGAEHEATVTPNVVGGDNVSTTLTYQKQNDDGQFTVITGKPKDAGTYKVIVSQISGEKASNYFISNTETEKSKTFTISQAINRWTTELSMNGWTYGETANEPSAAAAQGSATYKYYSKVADSEEYVSLDAKPTNAGTWYVKASVTGVANYNDLTSGCVEFVIAKATPTITLNVPTTAEDLIYDGNPKTVTASVSGVGLISTTVNLSYKVKDADDATYAETAPQNAGSYTVKASYDGDANHKAAEVTANFTIKPKTLTAEMVKLDPESFTYNGRAQQPNISATDADLSETITVTPTWSTEYTYTNVGTYNVTVTASGNYTGSTTKSYSITKVSTTIAGFSVADKIYDGNAIQVTAPKVTRGESAVEVADATLTFYQGETALTFAPVNAGSYTVKATYEGNANHKEAMKTADFTIQPKELTAEMVKLDSESFTYNGRAQQPNISATDATLNEAINVTPTWSTGDTYTNVGTHNVTVTATGNYTGSIMKSYSITQVSTTIADFSVAGKPYDGNAIQVTAPKVTRGESAVEVADATLTFYQGETPLSSAPLNAGSYMVKASYAGDDNHAPAADVTKTFTISKATPTIATIIVSDKTYDGNAIAIEAPAVTGVGLGNVTAKLSYKTKDAADDTYATEAPKKAGTYTVKAYYAGDTNHEEATKTADFTIAKATPTYEVPTGLTATYGQILAEVTLPNGWTWEEADTTPVGIVGTNKFHAKFTPEDTDNYNVVEQVEVSILVSAADPNFTFAEPSLTITQGEEVPANALTKPEDCTVTYSSDNEKVATVDADGVVTVVGVGTAIITATAGGNYTGTATYTLTVKAAYNPPSDPVYYTVTIPTEVTGAIIHDGGTHEVEAYTYLTFRIEIDPNGSGAYPQVTGLWGELLTPDSEGNYRLYVTGDTEVTIGEVTGYNHYALTFPTDSVAESDSTYWSGAYIEVIGATPLRAEAQEAGSYEVPFGTTVTLRPIETAERKFLQWEDGSTERERTLTLRADEEIRALWQKVSAVGIEEIAANSLIHGERGQLYIEVPVSCDAVIYSYNGVPVRMAHLTEGSNRIHSLPAGLYLVQIGHARAVAVRVR